MTYIAEILLLAALPISALLLNNQPFAVTASVMGSLCLGLLVSLSVAHHHERGKLQPAKFAEYLMLVLVTVTSYLFLV